MCLPGDPLGNVHRKLGFARGKGDVIGVTRLGTAIVRGKLAQMNVKHMTDEVGNDRRARTTLRQNIFVARYLRQYRRYIRMKHEVGVFDKKATDAAEIDRTEEIVEVDVKDITPLFMLCRVGNDRPLSLETMCQLIS